MSHNSLVVNLTLSLAIPLEVSRYVENMDRWEADTEIVRGYAQVLAHQGDELLFKQEGTTAKIFCVLAKSLAWSSFQPGGVRFNGYHYEVVNGKLQISELKEKT